MAEGNVNARLEAFCDGVFAIALTLLIIEIRPPSPADIGSTQELWHALHHLVPAAFAFLLSFGVILITWVNHHAALKLVNRSSASFIYANGFLLLTVVTLPFPAALLGEFLWTPSPEPAVIIYNTVLALQAIGWILLGRSALKNKLTRSDAAAATMRDNTRHGYFAFVLYSLLAIAAIWFPIAVAAVTAATWTFWLILGIRMKQA